MPAVGRVSDLSLIFVASGEGSVPTQAHGLAKCLPVFSHCRCNQEKIPYALYMSKLERRTVSLLRSAKSLDICNALSRLRRSSQCTAPRAGPYIVCDQCQVALRLARESSNASRTAVMLRHHSLHWVIQVELPAQYALQSCRPGKRS